MTTHGYGGYTNGCRCEVCRRAKADYMRDRRAYGRTQAQKHTLSATGARGARHNTRAPGSTRYLAPLDVHGTRAGYDEHGCRCFDCTDARLASDRGYVLRKRGQA